MLKINVEAFADESRPRGGYAVILLRGVSNIPPQPTIRLKPIDSGLDGHRHRAWLGEQIIPVATRLTDQGIQIVVGPEVVGNPHLLTGTPVMIEIPAANVRGEFVWPNVVPLAQPRRRHMAAARRGRPQRPLANGHAPGDPPHIDAEVRLEPATSNVVPFEGAVNGAVARAADAPAPAEGAILVPETAPIPATPETTEKPAAPIVETTAALVPVEPIDQPPELAPPPVVTPSAGAVDRVRWEPIAQISERRRWLLAAGLAVVSIALSTLLYAVGARHASRNGAAPPPTAAVPAKGDPIAQAAAAPSGAGQQGPAAKRGPSGGGGASGGTKAVAIAPMAVAVPPGTAPCREAEITTEPLDGGMMRIRISSQCRANQSVRMQYGGAELVRHFDAGGTLDAVLDCFAGQAAALETRFEDGTSQPVRIQTKDLDRVSKVAVVWRAPVNLDLHAFEYASGFAQKGHVWAKATSALETARADSAADGRGRGFLSSQADAATPGDKVEVYTFLHRDEALAGLVTFALDHETRGSKPKEPACGRGQQAEVQFTISTLFPGGRLVRENGVLASADCGTTLAQAARFQALPAPVLKISQ